jgi:hypothetical protein
MAFAKPFDLPLIPESEWADRLAERIAKPRRSCPTCAIAVSMASRFPRAIRTAKVIAGPIRPRIGLPHCARRWRISRIADLSARSRSLASSRNFNDQGGWGAESLSNSSPSGHPDERVLAAEVDGQNERQRKHMGQRQAASRHGMDGHAAAQQGAARDVFAVEHPGRDRL